MKSAAEPQNEKLTAKKLLDLSPTLLGRLNKHAATRRHGSANDIARRAIEAECDRLDALTDVEGRRAEKLKHLAALTGGDAEELLDRLIREHSEPQLPLPAGAGA